MIVVAGCAAAADPLGAAVAHASQKSVLILLPGQPGLPAATAVAVGIRSTLISVWSTAINIETEHVDTARFREPHHEQHLRELYRIKYAGHAFDAIIAAGDGPLDFVLKFRRDLWPATPIVVCAVDERTPSRLTPLPGMTVITLRYDMEGTLGAALTLLPETRHVALVGGASPQDIAFHELGRRAVRSFGDRLGLIDLTRLSVQDVTARLTTLPERTVVLASSFQVDGAGRRFYGAEIVGPLSAAANQPLFSVFGTVLGLGIVGGALTDFDAIGREAGQLTQRVLRGDPVSTGVVASAASSTLLFDWRQLRRWGLPESRLPVGSRVLYRQLTVWEQYRWHIVALISLIVAQAALIVGLVVERHRRRRAQEGLAERLRFEALVAEISATFASLPTRNVDAHIRDYLRRVALFLGVERGALWRPAADGTTVSPTHSWTAEGEPPPPTAIRISDLPFARETFEKGRLISCSNLDDLPPEAARERQVFARTGVRAFVAVPLRISDRTLGVMAFVSLQDGRSWPDEVIQQIRTLGELFANALMREQTAGALETSEALTGAVLTALPGETAIVDRDGMIVQTNEAWETSAQGHSPEIRPLVSVGANYLSTCRAAVGMPEEAARTALDLIESVLGGAREDAVLEYPCVRDGRDRWFEMHVRRLARPEGGAAITHSDATERKRAEAAAQSYLSEIAHLDRVAALGELAASLAHELNQPLTAILSNAQAASRFLAAAPPNLEEVRECLEDITNDDRRAGEVIRRMRQLLKKRASDLQPIVVNTLVANAIALVANDALLHAVSIEFAPATALPVVRGDAIQLQQVVLNLLANGITAASTGPLTGRTVAVSTFARANHVEIDVRDSGRGIAPGDLGRLFEPFFTTKPDGLGMGLAISRSIVEAHGGRIWAENESAGGAIFRVELPVPEQPHAADRSGRATTDAPGDGRALDFGPMAPGARL